MILCFHTGHSARRDLRKRVCFSKKHTFAPSSCPTGATASQRLAGSQRAPAASSSITSMHQEVCRARWETNRSTSGPVGVAENSGRTHYAPRGQRNFRSRGSALGRAAGKNRGGLESASRGCRTCMGARGSHAGYKGSARPAPSSGRPRACQITLPAGQTGGRAHRDRHPP